MTDDELFLTAILGCSRSELYLHPRPLTHNEQSRLNDMRRRRLTGEPVQYLTGFTEFFGYRFDIGPDVLIPRPETEILADMLIRTLKAYPQTDHRILDIGTGSGCLAITIAKELSRSRVTALDISEKALEYARHNSMLNATTDRVECINRDMFWYLDETTERFDAIVSNPPYIPSYLLPALPVDVRYEPELALDGGPDGLHFYRFLIPTSFKILKPGGILALEFGDGQAKELEKLFASTGHWDKINVYNDNAGESRVILAQKSL
ncbi:MAG: peptide chain release factor N(5)-glutamine methyltransferase [Candidatus Omnitrophota bacterium]